MKNTSKIKISTDIPPINHVSADKWFGYKNVDLYFKQYNALEDCGA